MEVRIDRRLAEGLRTPRTVGVELTQQEREGTFLAATSGRGTFASCPSGSVNTADRVGTCLHRKRFARRRSHQVATKLKGGVRERLRV